MLRTLDLFSGIGGFSLGLERTGGFETAAFCEIDPFCRRVLAKHWPDIPIHEDIRKLTGADVGAVDLVSGGFPCQPFSLAGKREGASDDRHLWPEMYRLVDELRPAWVIGENVAGHISMGLDQVLSDLEGSGYTCRPFVIPACAVDAPHRRDRVWIVANARHAVPGQHTNGLRPRGEKYVGAESAGFCQVKPADRNVDDAVRRRHWGEDGEICARGHGLEYASGWLSEPGVGRVAHGIPRRVDRLKGLGNAVVPQVVEMIGQMILAVMANEDNKIREQS